MASFGSFCVELSILLAGLAFRPSHSEITLTIDSVQPYSAIMRWSIIPEPNTNISNYNIRTDGEFKMKLNVTVDNATTSYTLTGLDDMRSYNACVMTIVSMMTPEKACMSFTTPMGNSTQIAIVSGVFIVLCLVIFGILDFVVSNKRKKFLMQKEEELLEQGWKTWERNSNKKKKGKGKKRQAPEKPRPNSSSSNVRASGAPSIDSLPI